MDSQCVLTLDGLSKSTEIAVDGGNKPYWISNVVYPVKEGHPTLIKVRKQLNICLIFVMNIIFFSFFLPRLK